MNPLKGLESGPTNRYGCKRRSEVGGGMICASRIKTLSRVGIPLLITQAPLRLGKGCKFAMHCFLYHKSLALFDVLNRSSVKHICGARTPSKQRILSCL